MNRESLGVLTPERALLLGQAVGVLFKNSSDSAQKVLIGKEPRRRNYVLESAIQAGFMSVGINVLLTGPMPTFGVAMLVRSMRADFGVMITAPNETGDNGVKLFASDGMEIIELVQNRITELMSDPTTLASKVVPGEEMGFATRIEGLEGRYIEFVKRAMLPNVQLDGKRIVIDVANGTAYKMGPKILEELGAEVFALNVSPNGLNINIECGFFDPKIITSEIKRVRADFGIALNGDGTSVTLYDNDGGVMHQGNQGQDALFSAVSFLSSLLKST